MECIVLAGGLGTRLRSVVADLPKCMANVAGKPFLHYIFKYLEQNGVTHVILSVGYLHEVIEEWVKSNKWSFEISFALEEEPLGTGGAIQLATTFSKEEHVLVMNGDTFFDVNLQSLMNRHIEKRADLSIALKPMIEFDRYGNVGLDNDGNITSFQEKQYCELGQINGGTYVINNKRNIFANLPTKFSFETEVLQKRLLQLNMIGVVGDGYFIDIGIPDDFEKANIEFKTLFV